MTSDDPLPAAAAIHDDGRVDADARLAAIVDEARSAGGAPVLPADRDAVRARVDGVRAAVPR